MLPDKQMDIIRQIQTLQAKLENDFDAKVPEIFSTLSTQVIDLVADLPLDPKKRAQNIIAIGKAKRQIAGLIAENEDYVKEVKGLEKGFRELSRLHNSYFSELIDGFDAKEALYQEILKANIQTTRDALLGAGIRDNFGNAITETLRANAAGVSDRRLLNQTLRQFIEGSEKEVPFLNRYIKQTVSDSVMTFSREYNQTIAADLDLQYYFYAGTLIADSRSFCKARAGRFFKKSEVESWASLGKWDGRKAGTNKTTIFTYLGGWGCRHDIYPATKEQYVLAQKNGTAGMR